MPDLPQPLRSFEQPDGLDDLSEVDFLRVGQANTLYDFSAACYDLCCELDKLFVCGNPKDSLYWVTTPWADLVHADREIEQIHQACAYGANRPKWTKLVANFEEIMQINKVCPGDHKHAPWGLLQRGTKMVFATSLEVHYPAGLCGATANAIAVALHSRGISPAIKQPVNQAAKAFSQCFLACFGQRKMQANHPLNVLETVPEELMDTTRFNLDKGPHEVMAHRVRFLSKWLQRAKELGPEEQKLKQSMDPDVAAAVKCKRILLFEEILEELQYPDIDVVKELKQGAELVGCVPATGMLPGKFAPAVSFVSELESNAKLVRPMLDAECKGSGDETIDATVWKKTLEEVEMGWLRGPLQKCSVPVDQTIFRRFGLMQKKGKVRLIDDYTESGVNSCV
eukprot:s3045_g2.t1